jgi:alpha-1,2-mannosyltransferase
VSLTPRLDGAVLSPLTRRLLAAAGLVLLTMALWVRWWGVPWSGLDLRIYLAGARTVVDGHALYALGVSNGHGGTLQFSYPPFAAMVFVPLLRLGHSAPAVVAVASVVACALSGAVVVRSAGWRLPAAGWLLLVALVLEPVQRTLLYGQVNLFLMLLVLCDVFVLPRRWRGSLIGLAAGVKLTPAIFVFYYLLRRDWAAAARAGGVFGVTVLVGWLVLPRDSATYWLHGLASMSQFGAEVTLWGNQSVPAVVQRATQLHGVAPLAERALSLGANALVLALAWWAARAQNAASDRLAVVVVLGLAGLLISPVSWTHHWVWVVPALVVLVRRGRYVLAALTVLVFFLPPMWVLHDRSNTQQGYTWGELLLSAAFVLWAMLVLVVLLADGRRLARIAARRDAVEASLQAGDGSDRGDPARRAGPVASHV